jgi:hypothetical protein
MINANNYTEINGIKIPTFDMFRKTFTNGAGRPERRFIEMYGKVSFENAYPVYVSEIISSCELSVKISKFEKHLLSIGIEPVLSNISESRYYNHNGMKYRFSNHVYPTGSMTSDNCMDFGADKHLINNITF